MSDRMRIHVVPRHEVERFEEFLATHGACMAMLDDDPDGLAIYWFDVLGNPVDVSDYPGYTATFDQIASLPSPNRTRVIR